jgi:small conductance mechanosensitive channel
MDFEILKGQILPLVTLYGGKIVLALVAFIIGRIVIGRVSKFVSNVLEKRKVDKDVQPFMNSLLLVFLNIMLLLSMRGSSE